MDKKTRSEEQNSQLQEWLSCHDYDEVLDLLKADPPEGFALTIHKSTLSRYYHEHSFEIDKLRQERILYRALENQRVLAREEGVRYFYQEAAALRIQEHLCDLLTQPIKSASELKALASVTRLISQLGIDLSDPDKDFKTMQKLNQILRTQKQSENSGNDQSNDATV
jgi:hypothetical protein